MLLAGQDEASLLKEIKQARQDTDKVKLLNKLAKQSMDSKADAGLDYAKQALALSLRKDYGPGAAIAYCNFAIYHLSKSSPDSAMVYLNKGLDVAIGPGTRTVRLELVKRKAVTHYYKGSTDSALTYFKLALNEYQQLKDSAEIIKALNNIGAISLRNGDEDAALNYFFQCLRFDEKTKDKKGIASDCNSIGVILTNQRSFVAAMAHLQRSLKIRQGLEDSLGIARTILSIGNLHNEKRDHRAAIEKYNEALKICDRNNFVHEYGLLVNNLAVCHTNTGEYKEAMRYVSEAIEIKKATGDKSGVGSSLNNLSGLYHHLKQYDKALECSLEAEKIGRETGDLAIELEANKGQVDLYLKLNRTKDAERAFEKFVGLKDSVFNESSSEKIADMQTRYETEKKELENSELKRKNEMQALVIDAEAERRKNTLLISGGSILLVVLLSFFVVYRRRARQQALMAQERAEQEKLRFKAVIDAEEKERARIAQELHDGVGQMLTAAGFNVSGLESYIAQEHKPHYQRTIKIIHDAASEVRNISHNMMPDALIRLGLVSAIEELAATANLSGKLKVELDTNTKESLGQASDIAIYRIVQEVLNNMLKHAQADKISISLHQKNDQLVIRIRDNGVGFDTTEIKNSKGLGWKGIYSRVAMMDGEIRLDSRKNEGTAVEIKLRIKPS